ncbi:hypothetical protein IFR04_002005 [Cadophora malorum]|uniref:Uncharacterized protein n=1 Tax=Cadophora malorum TaxID=108018 RepID=A0A8H7WHA6_9HELO|nr:hypothetical protein IFR04_002005 [Cadophora malorum]
MSSGSISLMTFLDSSSMSKIVTEFFGRYRSSSLLELATIDVIETSWESVTASTASGRITSSSELQDAF